MKHYKVIASGKNFNKAVKQLRDDCNGKFEPRTKTWAISEEIPSYYRSNIGAWYIEVDFQQATRNWVHQEMDKANSDL